MVDLGAKTLDANDDYTHYAYTLCTKVLGEEDDSGRGILVCGSGQGMSMAANRIAGIRAALAWDEQSAIASKADDDSNVLALPARFIEPEHAISAVDAWLKTKFKADPKYRRRLDELGDLRG